MEILALLGIVVFAVWVVYKLGLFTPIVALSDAANISATDFADAVAAKSVQKASAISIDSAMFSKAMVHKAQMKSYRESMVYGYEAEVKETK